MDKFAFIGHPIDINHFYRLSGIWGNFFKKIPPYFLKRILLKLPPYKYHLIRIKSITGAEAIGYAIILPLLPEQIAFIGEENALKKVLSAVKLAEKLGAKIVALGGFTSVVGNEGEYISKKVNIAVTSGNTFPAYLSLVGIKKACEKMRIDMKNSTATVIGATGDIGSICTKILSKQVKKIRIVARTEKKLIEFAELLKKYGTAQVEVFNKTSDAISDSDIILTATTSVVALIDPLKLKPGAIVCDVAVPANVTKDVVKMRDDVLVFEGGLTKLPFYENMNDKKFKNAMLEKNCVFGCLGEVILLALENRFENFSLGRGNISEKKIEEIAGIAAKHGFEVSDFFSGYKVFSDQDLEIIVKNAHEN